MSVPRGELLAVRAVLTFVSIVGCALLAAASPVAEAESKVVSPLGSDPPHVLAFLPANGTTNVSASAAIVARFSKTMNTASVETALRIEHGSVVRTKANGSFVWSSSRSLNDTVSFDSSENWPLGIEVTVALNASIAHDTEGMYLDGDWDNASVGWPIDDVAWRFTVEERDTLSPFVVASYPAAFASAVSETTDISLVFSEEMNRTSVEETFTLVSHARTWRKTDGTFAWPRPDRTSYTPSSNLAYGTAYAIRISSGSTDVNGNLLDGDGDGEPGNDFLSSFTTRQEPDTVPPRVVSTYPAHEATNVPRKPTIFITFDDAMDRAATAGAIAVMHLGEPVASMALGSFEWSAADHTLSFPIVDTLAWNSSYRVSVGVAAKDDAGLGLPKPYAFTFRTSTWTGRVVGTAADGSIPVAGATVTLGTWTTRTNETGAFSFEGVRAGTYAITIAKAGYESTHLTRTLDHRNTTDGEGLSIDLGVLFLRRSDSLTPAAMAATAAAVFVALVSVGFLLRRRKRRSIQLDDLAPEDEDIGQ